MALAEDDAERQVRVFRVPSPSMVPTFDVGAQVRVDLQAYERGEPARHDIVIVHPPRGAETHRCGDPRRSSRQACARPTEGRSEFEFIKRVAGLPGDRLSIQNNRAVVNGKQLDEPYVKPGTTCDIYCNLPEPITIPPDHYFVMGDNRGESDDSRDWGPVPREYFVGRVLGD